MPQCWLQETRTVSGARLFVAPRTVPTHFTHVGIKLELLLNCSDLHVAAGDST
jgi:hypothetical protein